MARRAIKQKNVDISGVRFGRLVAIREAGRRSGFILWECKCDCGGVKVATRSHLTSGCVKSCGCVKSGVTKKELYSCWASMVQRCTNKNSKDWGKYGGRGITVCNRWLNGEGLKRGFECFLEDMGDRPSKDYSIDRIDNNQEYGPRNCRWATKAEQARNTRRNYFSPNVDPMKICEANGVRYGTFRQRVSRGWTIEKALDSRDFRGRPRK